MWRYVSHQLRHGYDHNPLEITARAAARDSFFLAWARDILKTNLALMTQSGLGSSGNSRRLT